MTYVPQYYVESLDVEHHEIQAFSCGKPVIDDVLHRTSRLIEYGQTYVVVPYAGDPHVLACLTLLPDIQEVFSVNSEYMVILLNILAVDIKYQRMGIGKWILSQLMLYIVQQSQHYNFDYLLIEPLDEESSE